MEGSKKSSPILELLVSDSRTETASENDAESPTKSESKTDTASEVYAEFASKIDSTTETASPSSREDFSKTDTADSRTDTAPSTPITGSPTKSEPSFCSSKAGPSKKLVTPVALSNRKRYIHFKIYLMVKLKLVYLF